MAIMTKRIPWAWCGERDTIIRGGRGCAATYCDSCRAAVKGEQVRERMQALRARRVGSGG